MRLPTGTPAPWPTSYQTPRHYPTAPACRPSAPRGGEGSGRMPHPALKGMAWNRGLRIEHAPAIPRHALEQVNGTRQRWVVTSAAPRPPSRQRKRFIANIVITTSSRWLMTSIDVRTIPRSGFDRERFASSTVTRARSESPGRTGFSQRSSSIPGRGQRRPLRQVAFDEHAHDDAGGVPAARDQSSERSGRGGPGVDVDRLRVVALRRIR